MQAVSHLGNVADGCWARSQRLTVFDERIPLWIIWNDSLVGEALAFIALNKIRFTLRSCIPIGIGATAAPDHVGMVPELAG